MPSVRRSIHIDAPPELVRPHLDEPALRRGWLDEEVELSPAEDGVRRFSDDRGAIERHVHIRLDPDGGGTRITVTESLGEEPDAGSEPSSDAEVVALHGWSEHQITWPGEGRIAGTGLDEETTDDPLRPRLVAA
jgi:hypothetical protein